MKRHGNLYGKITDIENLREAYRKAKRGKSAKSAIKRFQNNSEVKLDMIRNSLVNHTFQTSKYQTRWVFEPKPRQIYILPFAPDRIVQHALMNVIEPIWDKLLISDSYACRVGKGIHAGSRKCMEFVRRYRYCLKCDISKFYPSVDHDTLFDIIQRKIKCQETLWLISEIIYSISGGKNVPIGNYTSQWFGNLYLNELDQYLKHVWKIKPYIRYCDDFITFSNDKHFLNEVAVAIKEFCSSKLKLSLSKCDLFQVKRGVDFLGYRHFPNYILLRKSTAKRVKKRLELLPSLLARGFVSFESYMSSIASTQGWLKWANSHNLELTLKLKELENVAA